MTDCRQLYVIGVLLLAFPLMLFPLGKNEDASEAGPEPVTFSILFADENQNWDYMMSDVGMAVKKKTGVTLEIETPEGDTEKYITLIAASGDFPDMISPKGTSGALLEAGALLDLTDMIDKHGPNIKQVLGDLIVRLRYSNEDPSIYFIPSYDSVNDQTYSVGGVFALQLDVIQKLGYPMIRTVQDFEYVIKMYKQMYPEIDGKETIGLSLLADDWRILISTTNPAFYSTGAPDDGEFYIDPETYQAMLHYKRPVEREYFRWLNHMNDIGLLDPESFVQKWDQYQAKITTGRVIGLIDMLWNFSQAEDALKGAGKFERTYGFFPVTLTDEYITQVTAPYQFSGGWGIGITTACKDPVRALTFLDYLSSEEGQILVNWGIEGKHYYYEDGKRIFRQEYTQMRKHNPNQFKLETGIGNYQISARYGNGNLDSTGNYYTLEFPEQILALYSDLEKEILSHYSATYWKDIFPSDDMFEPSPWGGAWSISIPNNSPVSVFLEKERAIIQRRIPESILADPSEFDEIYDLMLREFEEIGATEMEALYSEYVKKRIELWSN